jgi:hypothetical protein
MALRICSFPGKHQAFFLNLEMRPLSVPLRRSRYRGFAKVELQNLLLATACNIKRWLRAIIQSFPRGASPTAPQKSSMLSLACSPRTGAALSPIAFFATKRIVARCVTPISRVLERNRILRCDPSLDPPYQQDYSALIALPHPAKHGRFFGMVRNHADNYWYRESTRFFSSVYHRMPLYLCCRLTT